MARGLAVVALASACTAPERTVDSTDVSPHASERAASAAIPARLGEDSSTPAAGGGAPARSTEEPDVALTGSAALDTSPRPTENGLTEDEKIARFWSTAADPPTAFLDGVSEELYGRHYVVSDEWHLELFAPAIQGLGGGYLGVGTDQAFLFVGWQRAEWAWFIDYDPYAVMLHRIYALLIGEAASPEELQGLFDDDVELARALELIDAAFTDPVEHALAREVMSYADGRVTTRLWKLRAHLDELGLRAWINDQAEYDWLKGFLASRHARAMSGNLLDTQALRGIGEAATALGCPIRVLYLSNAEEYWTYTDAFRDNLRALHFDDASLILRTIAAYERNDDYRYFVQPARSFLDFLAEPELDHVYKVAHRRRIKDASDIPFERIDDGPADALARVRERATRNPD